MLSVAPGPRIWLCVQPTDMRRFMLSDGYEAYAAYAQQNTQVMHVEC